MGKRRFSESLRKFSMGIAVEKVITSPFFTGVVVVTAQAFLLPSSTCA